MECMKDNYLFLEIISSVRSVNLGNNYSSAGNFCYKLKYYQIGYQLLCSILLVIMTMTVKLCFCLFCMSGLAKKRKVAFECHVFKEKWSLDYFIIEKVLCLVCNKSVAVFKEFNIHHHYEMKHVKLWKVFRKIMSLQQHVFKDDGKRSCSKSKLSNCTSNCKGRNTLHCWCLN